MNIFTQYKGLKRDNYILFFGRMVTNLGSMIWPMMTMILNQKLGFSAANTALFIIVMGIIVMPAHLIGGSLADRFNKKRFIVLCDSISVFLYLVCATMPLSTMTMLVFDLAALFQNMEAPASQALVAAVTPKNQREKAYSLLYLGGNVGLILSPIIAGFLFNHFLWLCFLINACSIGISTILIARKVTGELAEEETNADEITAQQEKKDSILQVFHGNLVLILFMMSFALYEGAYSQFGYLMPLSLSAVHGSIGPSIYGTVMSMNCIVVVVLTPIITKLFEKKALYSKFSIGAILQLLSFAIFLLVLGHVWGYYLSIVIFTMGEIFTCIVFGPIFAESVSENFRGRIYGISSFVSSFMTGVCEWSSGRLFDMNGPSAAWILSIGLALIAVLGALITWRVHDRKMQRMEEGV